MAMLTAHGMAAVEQPAVQHERWLFATAIGKQPAGSSMQPFRAVHGKATDERPAEAHVKKFDAMEALDRFADFDVLFVSWVPYESALDYGLAKKWCGEMWKPMIIVGEGWGGCTGSQEFWGYTPDPAGESTWDTIDFEVPYRRESPSGLVENFEDVPRWNGMSDHTTVVLSC